MKCPVCQASADETFLERAGVPVHQNLLMRDVQAATSARRGDLQIVACPCCGFVFNAAFDESLLSYGPDYDNTQTCSTAFRSHIDELIARLAKQHGGRGCRILEVGCGQGQFLTELVEAAGDGTTGIGFDPSYKGPTTAVDGRVRFERQFYGPETETERADIILCRHVIEHVADPVSLIRAVRTALVGSSIGRAYFETPTVEWILRHHVVWDFFYEHCSYFSADSLATAFRLAAFDVDDVHHVFGGQYLWLEAQLGAAPDRTLAPGDVPALARSFAAIEPPMVERMREQVRHWAADGAVALWGAGAKGATLAHLIDPDRTLLRCVVDLNPEKQDRFLPGTGHRIVGFRDLAALDVRTAILMNPNYRAENNRLLRDAGLDVTLTELL